jgi:hypothetical protein
MALIRAHCRLVASAWRRNQVAGPSCGRCTQTADVDCIWVPAMTGVQMTAPSPQQPPMHQSMYEINIRAIIQLGEVQSDAMPQQDLHIRSNQRQNVSTVGKGTWRRSCRNSLFIMRCGRGLSLRPTRRQQSARVSVRRFRSLKAKAEKTSQAMTLIFVGSRRSPNFLSATLGDRDGR